MKKCTVCNEPLIKKGRTEHYKCRCVKKFQKNGSNTCDTRRKTAFNAMIEKPNVFRELFS